MDVITLVALIYDVGSSVIEQCKLVKQYPTESARIAIRCQNILGVLKDASHEFSGDVALETSLLELRQLLEQACDMVKRCQRPKRFTAKVTRVFRAYSTRDALNHIDARLERVTSDLRLPMLTDIRRQLTNIKKLIALGEHDSDSRELLQAGKEAIEKGMTARSADGTTVVGDVIRRENGHDDDAATSSVEGAPAHNNQTEAGTAAGGEGIVGEDSSEEGLRRDRDAAEQSGSRLIARLGRVRFESLELGEVLGEGSFGVVFHGIYMGKEVAVKKARTPVVARQTLEAFRCVRARGGLRVFSVYTCICVCIRGS